MFKFAAVMLFGVTPAAAVVAALSAGWLAAVAAAVVVPAVTIAALLARLLLTRAGREEVEALQGRRDGLRESLR